MAMQGPPGTKGPAVGGFTIQPPSVLIFGNPSLYDIAALSKLGQCSSNPSSDGGSIFIEVQRTLDLKLMICHAHLYVCLCMSTR